MLNYIEIISGKWFLKKLLPINVTDNISDYIMLKNFGKYENTASPLKYVTNIYSDRHT